MGQAWLLLAALLTAEGGPKPGRAPGPASAEGVSASSADEQAAAQARAKGVQTKTIRGQTCWVIRSDEVELAITKQGGNMAPVTFYRNSPRPVQPYYVSPWQEENLKFDEPVLRSLRGDFFCLPFGGNQEPVKGVKYPAHGETAGQPWTLVGAERVGHRTRLTLSLKTTIPFGDSGRPAEVRKFLELEDGQNVVYCRHVLSGYSSKAPLGHHATLAVPEREGSLRVATSPFVFGMTSPVLFSDPAQREYQSFAIGARFTDLQRVPLLWKEPCEADCTRLPARTGFADLLAIFKRPGRPREPAWMAVTNQAEGYLWFSLKDPAVLPSTVFWIENHGRHGPPWNGRNRCLGLEDVCAYFDRGIAPSLRPNELSVAGIPTALDLPRDRPTVIRYIQGVVKVPADFQTVQSVEFAPGRVTFVSVTGKRVATAVDHEFLWRGQ